MNHEEIERLLRKAPPMPVPVGLRERLKDDISLPGLTPKARWQPEESSWFKRCAPALSFGAFLVVGLAIIVAQSVSITKARQANRDVTSQSGAKAALSELSRAEPQFVLAGQELERLRKENAELRSLQTEVIQLRTELVVLPQLRAENQKLRAELDSMHSSAADNSLVKARQKAESIKCVNNLKNIGLAARIYATNHEDEFPPDFLSMKDELSTPKLLHCPGDIGKTEVSDWSELGPESNSYEMISPSLKISDQEPNVVFVRCPVHGHVCLSDGSVHQNPEQRGGSILLKNGRPSLVYPTQGTFQ
ncbi:MAG: hypothetical protein HY735_01525 [Verrucomicrobia bacterium]|nr:hypothetical protein [Verrucomicrobiota bacterium]